MTVSLDDLTAYLAGSGPERISTPEWIADAAAGDLVAAQRQLVEAFAAAVA